MKAVILVLSLAGVAAAAPLSAQIIGSRPTTTSTNRGTTVNGSWQVVGQDRSGPHLSQGRIQQGNKTVDVRARSATDENGQKEMIGTVDGRLQLGEAAVSNRLPMLGAAVAAADVVGAALAILQTGGVQRGTP